MPTRRQSTPLSRLFSLQWFSLPRFLVNASPRVATGDEPFLEVIENMAREHERMGSLIAEAILARQSPLPTSTFPMGYAGLHYMDVKHLFDMVLAEQPTVLDEILAIIPLLQGDEEGRQLAIDVQKNETTHLSDLEKLSSLQSKVQKGVGCKTTSAAELPPIEAA